MTNNPSYYATFQPSAFSHCFGHSQPHRCLTSGGTGVSRRYHGLKLTLIQTLFDTLGFCKPHPTGGALFGVATNIDKSCTVIRCVFPRSFSPSSTIAFQVSTSAVYPGFQTVPILLLVLFLLLLLLLLLLLVSPLFFHHFFLLLHRSGTRSCLWPSGEDWRLDDAKSSTRVKFQMTKVGRVPKPKIQDPDSETTLTPIYIQFQSSYKSP